MITKKIQTEIKEVQHTSVESITCDVCKKVYNYENDSFEIQEFYHIRNTGGYGAVFGDGDTVELDICQHCFFDLFKDYVRIIPEGEEN